VDGEKLGGFIELVDDKDMDVMVPHSFYFTLLMYGYAAFTVRPFELHPERRTLAKEDQVRTPAAPFPANFPNH
jgi:hypothetical protein